MDVANENYPSQLRPPSKIISPKKLSELSAAAANARPSAMLPPSHGVKRKTLAERGGEPIRPPPPAPSSRISNASVRATSIAALAREPSLTSSTSSRPTSAASSNTLSNGSLSSSFGSFGGRPHSTQPQRPRSAIGTSRIQRPHAPQHRPATSLESHQEEYDGEGSAVYQTAWDAESKLKEIEYDIFHFKEKVSNKEEENNDLRRSISGYKTRVVEYEGTITELTSKTNTLQIELDATKARLATSMAALDDAKRYHTDEIDDLKRRNQNRMENAKDAAETSTRQLLREQTEKFDESRRKFENDFSERLNQHRDELQKLRLDGASSQAQAEKELGEQKEESRRLQHTRDELQSEVLKERDLNTNLREKMSEVTSTVSSLESSVQRLESHIRFLESDNKSQSQAFTDLEARMQNAIKIAAEANEKLITEETLRRKLHNQIQEMKGNIRVFCRARPTLTGDTENCQAKITYPDSEADSKEIEVQGPEEKSSLGNITTRKNGFAFDRVFGPQAQNEEIFAEISQLVQSALDGFNVCIFCYGQTGSGKTFTMSAQDGMIPRAVHQIYDTAKSLEEKGWTYSMEGSFVEVYNENLNDLLGKAEELDNKKHEIKHDMQKGKTTITGVTTVELDSPNKVNSILVRATSNRSVAATQANERSSRSHSVFILKLLGENSITGEKSEGTLNLVDLAGSERLAHSGATGERLKETQNINKSLSCLGDVISALGQGKEGAHVPYRNSKLTYLLQNSLGGNSKTLMFVMISPLQAHLSETLTSLKFATKVHNTHIGTAKKHSRT